MPVNKIPANVLNGAQAWVDRIFKKTVLAPKLSSDGFGIRSSIHKDLISARYSHGSIYLQVVETGRNTMLFIKDSARKSTAEQGLARAANPLV